MAFAQLKSSRQGRVFYGKLFGIAGQHVLEKETPRKRKLQSAPAKDNQGHGMIHNNVILRVKRIEDIEEIKTLLAAQADVSLTEEGCKRFEVYQSETDAQTFILIEWWATQEDLDRHKAAKQFVEVYLPKVIPLVERFPHPSKRLA